MKPRFPFRPVLGPGTWALLAGAAVALPLHAQDDDITIDLNRIWVNARFAFNISAEFRTTSTPPLSTPPRYDDGYVLTDVSGSEDGKTWNWGYQSASQISGDNINFHVTTGSPFTGTSEEKSGDVQAGFEIVYGRVLGFFKLSEKRQVAWGVLGGFGTIDINIDGSATRSGTASRQTYQYSLGGIVPPVAPYSGSYEGPGPVIGVNSTGTSTSDVPLTSSQYVRLDSLALGFRLGPFAEVPLGRGFSLNLSAGVAIADVLNTFTYQETFSLPGAAPGTPPPQQQEEIDHSAWLVGYFGNATLNYALNYNLTVFAGVQYQSLGDIDIPGNGRTATLKLGQVLEAQIGLRASF